MTRKLAPLNTRPLHTGARRGMRCTALLLVALLTGCGASTDQSGWEIARKRSPAERPEAFPEIPVILPGPALTAAPAATGTPLEAVRRKALDEGSLFRRSYGAPTP
jgi:hypothetical protein